MAGSGGGYIVGNDVLVCGGSGDGGNDIAHDRGKAGELVRNGSFDEMKSSSSSCIFWIAAAVSVAVEHLVVVVGPPIS